MLQSLQGISYTTVLLFWDAGLHFHQGLSHCLYLFEGCFDPKGVHTLSTFSLTPLAYGRHRSFGGASLASFAGEGQGWWENVFFTSSSGKPLAWKMSCRCLSSSCSEVESQMWLGLSHIHLWRSCGGGRSGRGCGGHVGGFVVDTYAKSGIAPCHLAIQKC